MRFTRKNYSLRTQFSSEQAVVKAGKVLIRNWVDWSFGRTGKIFSISEFMTTIMNNRGIGVEILAGKKGKAEFKVTKWSEPPSS